MLEEGIKKTTTSGNTFTPTLINSYPLTDAKFGGHCLTNSNISAFREAINLYISYAPDTRSRVKPQISH